MMAGESLIAVVNPRARRDSKGRFLKRSHGGGKRRRRARHHQARRHHGRRAHRARTRTVTVVRTRRVRARSNPRFNMRAVPSELMAAAAGAAGALALDLALSYGGPYLPSTFQGYIAPGTWGRNIFRLALALGVGYGARFVVKRETAKAVAAGALAVVAYDIVKQVANPMLASSGHVLGGDGGSYPYTGYYPYLTGLSRGGSGGQVDGLRAFLPGTGRPRTTPIARVKPRLSAFIEPESGMSGLNADLEL